MHSISQCAICANKKLQLLWDLPKLPLSETFGEFDDSFDYYDQILLYCINCQHVQLKNQLPPNMLYNSNDYNYVTAKSSSTIKRFDSLRSFVKKNTIKQINSLVDIGGNDDSLLQGFDAEAKYLIDPSLSVNTEKNGVTYINKFVEELDLATMNPDVILCSHALEHIAQPAKFLQSLFSTTKQETLFFFEVPCFKKQIQSLRFDAFFHQHYHYFYPETLVQLIEDNGGEVLSLEYNAYPTCGGSLMVAFQQRNKSSKPFSLLEFSQNKESLKCEFDYLLTDFLKLNNDISEWIYSKNIVYGYGASLLLPIIFYHIGVAADKINYIFDDDKSKHGLTYKNIENLTVSSPDKHLVDNKDGLLITSYENIVKLSSILEEKYPNRQFKGFQNGYFQ